MGKNCGDDGCGASCGECSGALECAEGICACSPDCALKICGEDGCGGTCGACPDGMACENGGCILEGTQCYDSNSIPWDGCTGGAITEFRVNGHYPGDQKGPLVVTVDPSGAPFIEGGFVVAWEGKSYTDVDGIVLRLFDQKGVPITDDIQVNSQAANTQKSPTLVVCPDGPLVAAWQHYDSAENGYDIQMRRFSLDGAPLGEEAVVNSHVEGDQLSPASAALNDKSLVVVWQGPGPGTDSGVFARLHGEDGTAVGEQFMVNEDTGSSHVDPSVAPLQDGGFVVAWTADDVDGSLEGIQARTFSAAGAALTDPFIVNTYTTTSQDRAEVAALPSGGFVVAWHTANDGATLHEVYGQRFGSAPTFPKDGTDVHLNSYVSGEQTSPVIASKADDGFIVFWESSNIDSDSDKGVYGQLFSSVDAAVLPEELHANGYVDLDQSSPAVAVFHNGNFIVVWQSEEQAAEADIFAQRYLPDGTRLYR